MPCPACVERGKTWKGDDPKCGFTDGIRVFTTDNWNCATLNSLRDVAYVTHAMENKIGVVPHHEEGGFILLFWYKSRGATMQALWWDGEEAPKPLTLHQAEMVLSQV